MYAHVMDVLQSPMQNNFCDCGLYVLAFVEAFMQDPIASSEAIRVRCLFISAVRTL